ncbi:hypothetical protein Pelo_16178 [Pelomyxa schiedti]|nr:hypothetical protein Pelo_16178 [Pelomyxa schiedti]
MGCSFGQLIWAIIWFFCLLIVWPFSFLAAFLYVLICPFAACLDFCGSFEHALLKVVRFPLLCAENMVKGKEGC